MNQQELHEATVMGWAAVQIQMRRDMELLIPWFEQGCPENKIDEAKGALLRAVSFCFWDPKAKPIKPLLQEIKYETIKAKPDLEKLKSCWSRWLTFIQS